MCKMMLNSVHTLVLANQDPDTEAPKTLLENSAPKWLLQARKQRHNSSFVSESCPLAPFLSSVCPAARATRSCKGGRGRTCRGRRDSSKTLSATAMDSVAHGGGLPPSAPTWSAPC